MWRSVLSNYLGMMRTALLRLKSGQLIANQIWEFCHSYDYNDNDNDNNNKDNDNNKNNDRWGRVKKPLSCTTGPTITDLTMTALNAWF